LAYDEPQGWRARQSRIDEQLLASVHELAFESGQDEDRRRASLVEMHATLDCITRRVIIVAELVR